MPTTTDSWTDANQRVLGAHVARVKLRVERHLSTDPDDHEWVHREREAARRVRSAEGDLPSPSALDTLCATFGLSPFERDVVLLAAGPELDGSFASAWGGGGAHDGEMPTFALALSALTDPHWSAITPGGPLRHWRLVELGPGSGVTTGGLRIDERILHVLAGVQQLDERLDGIVDVASGTGALPPSQRAAVDSVVRIWTQPGRLPTIVQLCGPDRAARTAVAGAACASIGIPLNVLRIEALPLAAAEQELIRRLCERETALTGCALLLDCDPGDARLDEAAFGAGLRFADRFRGRVLLAAREPVVGFDRPSVRVDVQKPASHEQRAIWASALQPMGHALNGEVDDVVGQFDLSTRSIEAAASMVLATPALDGDRDLSRILWDASRSQARPRLDDLAQRIEPAAAWDDLVLPESQRQSLREMIVHARYRSRVYRDWGFVDKGLRGLGISALFSGPSGTGKTMAAEVLAGELRLDLYRIDLSSVVSKYIGETEKNLRRVFDAAEDGGTILLFDEADALFGKRSEVKDSHDRYANIEVGYLLQRMEAYRGIAILTTNLKSALDSAFLRRLRFIVSFPFPDPTARAEIWRRIFPAAAPVEGLQPETLARLSVTGGSIRNIALSGAFLAAEAGDAIRMSHLLQAARSEYAKLDRPLTDAEIGGW